MAGRDDDFDLDFDFDDSDFGGSDSKDLDPKSRKPIARVMSGVKKGVKRGARDKDLVKRTILRALPKGFSDTVDKGEQATRFAQDLYNKSLKDLDPLITSGADFLDKNLKEVEGKLPKSVADRLRKFADKNNSNAKRRGSRSQSQMDNDDIMAQLADVFTQQALADDNQEKKNEKSSKITQKNEKAYKDLTTQLLSGIYKNTQTANQLNAQGTVRYRKAMLETNLRQLYMQRDILESIKMGNERQLEQLRAIVKNSELPDVAKINKKEIFLSTMHQQAANALTGGIENYTRDYFKNVGRRIKGNVGNVTSQLGMMGGMMGMMGGGGFGGDPLSEFGESTLAPGILEIASMGLGAKAKKVLNNSRFGGRINRVGNRLSYLNETLPQQLMEWARKPDEKLSLDELMGTDSLLSKGKRVARAVGKDYLRGIGPQTGVKFDNLEGLMNADSPTRQTNKSITEIIPGLLSRILQSLEMSRTGGNVPMVEYDYTKNRFSTTKGIKAGLSGALFNKDTASSIESSLDNVIEKMGAGKLSGNAQALLRKQLLEDSMNMRRVSPEDYANIDRFSLGKGSEEAKELVAHFAGLSGMTDQDKMTLQRRVNTLGMNAGDIRGKIQQLTSIGYGSHLEQMGILSADDNGNSKVNLNAFVNRFAAKKGLKGKQADPLEDLVEELRESSKAMVAAVEDVNNSVQEQILHTESQITNSPGQAGLGVGSRTLRNRLQTLASTAKGQKKSVYNRLRNTIGRVTNKIAPMMPSSIMGIPMGGMIGNAQQAIGNMTDRIKSTLKDFYLPGVSEPLLKAADIAAGKYRDLSTGRPIFKIEDIKGTIVDASNNIIANAEQLKNCRTIDGETLKGILDTGKEAGASFIGSAKDFGKMVLSKVMESGDIDRDLYVPGEVNPRLLLVKLKNGLYTSRDGTPIRTYSDCRKGVSEKVGNMMTVIVSEQEIAAKGLVDVDGKTMLKAGIGILGKIKGAKDFGKRIIGGLKNLPGALKGLFKRGAGKLSAEEAGNAQVGIMGKLYDLMNKRLPAPEKGLRKGSYEWIKGMGSKIRGKTRDDRLDKKEKKEGDGILGLLGSIATGITGLVSFFMSPGGIITKVLGGIANWLGLGLVSKAGKWVIDKLAGRTAKKVAEKVVQKVATRAAIAVATEAAVGATTGTVVAGGAAGMGAMAATGVVISAAAILGTMVAGGYGIYKLSKRLSKELQYLTRLRYLQYGTIMPSDDDDIVMPVAALEIFIERKKNNVNMRELLNNAMNVFGIKDENDPKFPFLVTWLQKRFLPTFNAHVAAIKAHGGNIVTDTDETVPKKNLYDFVIATDLATKEVWKYKPLPLDSDGARVATIDKEYKMLLENLKSAFQATKKAEEVKEFFRGESERTTKYAAKGIAPKQATDAKKPDGENKATPEATTKVPGATGTSTQAQAAVAKYDSVGRPIDGISAMMGIRLKVYGIIDLTDMDDVNKMAMFEKSMSSFIKVSNGSATFNGISPFDAITKYGSVFGIDPADIDKVNYHLYWFNNRFLPAMMAYASAVASVSSTTSDIINAGERLKPSDALWVANQVIGAKDDKSGYSVWDIKNYPIFPYKANTDKSSVNEQLNFIKNQIKSSDIKVEAAIASKNDQIKNKTGIDNKPEEKGFLSKVMDYGKKVFSNTPQGLANKAGEKVVEYGKKVSDYIGNKAKEGSALGAQINERMGSSTPGADVLNAQGVGGQVSELMKLYDPKNPNGWDNLKQMIVKAAQMVGVDPGVMAAMAGVESNFKAVAAAGTSSATGLYQFIKGTWADTVRKYGSKYGLTSENQNPVYRNNPAMAALMGAEYIKENTQYLEKRLGRKLTAGDIYAAHFLGPKGAAAVLSAPDGDIAASHLGADQVRANKTVFYQGGKAITVGEFKNWVNKRLMKDYGKQFNEARQLVNMPAAPATENTTPAASSEAAGSNGGLPRGTTTTTPTGTAPSTPVTSSMEPTDDQMSAMGLPSSGGSGDGGATTAPAPTSTAPTAAPTFDSAQTTSGAPAYNTGSMSDALTPTNNILNEIKGLVEQGINYLINNQGGSNPTTPSSTKGNADNKSLDASPPVDMKRSYF